MQLSTIRTKYFPILFLVAGLLFAALFALFYQLVFDATYDILDRQNRRLLTALAAAAEQRHGDFLRETKLLHASRGVQRNAARLADGGRDEALMALRAFVLNWRKQVDSDAYRAVTYLGGGKLPVAAVDFAGSSQSSRLLDDSAVLESGNAGQRLSAADLSGSRTLLRSWQLTDETTVGTRSVALADSTEVLRTIFGIKHRRTGAVIGFVGIDQQLESVIAWSPETDRELLVFDSRTRYIVFDSADRSRSGESAADFYPGLMDAVDGIASREEAEPEKFTEGGRQYLASAILLDDLQWTIAVTVDLDAYMAEHEAQGLGLIVASLLFVVVTGASIYALMTRVRRRTDELIHANEVVSEHNRMLEEELQTAHDMQMRLMPQQNPAVAGFDIVGRCRLATEVGGDYYQYFALPDERIAITLADVTGHGMQAAIPTMLFSGLLGNQIEYTQTPDELMSRLNKSLHRVLERRTFVCLSMGELDPRTRRLRLANGGCPYPYLFRAAANTVEEVSLAAFPLGLRAESAYAMVEVEMDENDLVVFCSDGLIEAADLDGEIFGYERTAETIRQAGIDRVQADVVGQRLFDAVDAFSTVSVQEDDQTMVVIRVTDESPSAGV